MVKTLRWTALLVPAALLLLGLSGPPALAQEEDDELSGLTREQRERLIRQRIRQVFLQELRSRVDLTDDQMRELLPVLEDMEARRVETGKRRRGLTLQIRGLVEDPTSGNDEIAVKLRELRALEDEFAREEAAEAETVRGMLDPRQQAQLLVFQQEFRRMIEAKMTDLRREIRQRDAMRSGRRFRSGEGGPPGSREERP